MASRKPEMYEGPQAWERFYKALEAILSLDKDALASKGTTAEPGRQKPVVGPGE